MKQNGSLLSEKTMLIKLTVRIMNFWKKEKRPLKDIAEKYRVDNTEKLLGVTKRKLSKDYTARITKIANSARNYFYEVTLPWLDDGWRLLPVELHNKVVEKLRKYKVDFEEAEQELSQKIEEYKNVMQIMLGDLFDEKDYNTEDKFEFSVSRSPVPTSGHIVLDLGKEEMDNLIREVDERGRQVVEYAMKDVWNRLYNVIDSLHKKMIENERRVVRKRGDKKIIDVAPPIFRNSIIKNIRELCGILPALNITKNPKLEQIRQDVLVDLASLDPEQLRVDIAARDDTAIKAENILNRLKGIMP